jgi:hypothetical protein
VACGGLKPTPVMIYCEPALHAILGYIPVVLTADRAGTALAFKHPVVLCEGDAECAAQALVLEVVSTADSQTACAAARVQPIGCGTVDGEVSKRPCLLACPAILEAFGHVRCLS